MRLYRVHTSTAADSSQGYDFWPSKRAAAKSANELGRAGYTVEITVIDFKPTKTGILNMLRIYASHPDNG